MAKMKLRRVGVISVALWQSPVYMVIGFIFGLVYGLPGLMTDQLNALSFFKYILGVAIGYGVGGFIATATGCVIFNAVSKGLGGITLELDNVDYRPPPLPEL